MKRYTITVNGTAYDVTVDEANGAAPAQAAAPVQAAAPAPQAPAQAANADVCANCGAPLNGGAFCTKCGTPAAK